MNIQNKLFFVLFGFSATLVATLIVLIQGNINEGMLEYVNNKEIERNQPVIDALAAIYQRDSGWSTLQGNDKALRRLVEANMTDEYSPPSQNKPPRRPPPQGRPPLEPPPEHRLGPRGSHFALLDASAQLLAGRHYTPEQFLQIPIQVNAKTVGFYAITKRDQLTKGYEFDFIKQQKQFLWFIALIALAFVAIVTVPLSRHLVIPVKLIASGIHMLTQGKYEQSIHLKRKDELGELSKDYNELALTLAESEKSRKRWLANISHELRTPVAILRGELEAMLDGVRSKTEINIASAYDEIRHLQRLINDLHLLTSADVGGMRYQKSNIELTSFLNDESAKLSGYLSNAGIELVTDISSQAMTVFADKTRLSQLFENIINNAIKYSKANLVKISLKTTSAMSSVSAIITVEDDGVGVDTKHLEHLFDYLYRVDEARNREDGGTGLGLSICRQIIDAHQGRIVAKLSALGGLAVEMAFPLVD